MKDLIAISQTTIDGQETMTVDGRSLHSFLESKQQFADWMKNRIEKYGFTEGIDFVVFHNSMKNSEGRSCIDYALSIGMGKELAMVENNDKGRQARLYFIECERRALEAANAGASLPRRADAELNARSAAISFRMLARMTIYPQEMRAVFAAKSAALLTGEPLAGLLPPVVESRESWLSPTAQGENLGVSRNAIGRALKVLGLHGENDPEHKWSQPLWDKSPHSNKEVVSFIYDPAVVIPALKKYFEGAGPDSSEPH